MVFYYQLRLNLATCQYGPIDLFQKLPNVLSAAKEQENISFKNQKQLIRSKRSLQEQGKQSNSSSGSSSSNSSTPLTVTRQQQQQQNAPPPTPAKAQSTSKRSKKQQQQQQRKQSNTIITTSALQNDFRLGKITIESIEEKNEISTTQCGSGTLHLYRETKNEDISSSKQQQQEDEQEQEIPVILCVLAIPTYMQPLDFIKFTGTSIESYRIIRYVIFFFFLLS